MGNADQKQDPDSLPQHIRASTAQEHKYHHLYTCSMREQSDSNQGTQALFYNSANDRKDHPFKSEVQRTHDIRNRTDQECDATNGDQIEYLGGVVKKPAEQKNASIQYGPEYNFETEYISDIAQCLGWLLCYIACELLVKASLNGEAKECDKGDGKKEFSKFDITQKATISDSQKQG